MVRSMAEKPTSSGVEASSTTCRSSRTDPGFQPNSVRIARVSQLSAAGRSTSPSCTTAGRLRVLRGLSWVGSESGIFSLTRVPIRIRIGNAELRQDLPLEAFHRFGVVVFFVVVADQMQEAMDRQMAEMMIERLLFVVGLPARGLIGDGDVAEHARRIVGAAGPVGCSAGNDSTLVGLSMPRQLLFRVRMPASSVSMTASSASPASASTISAAASMARCTMASASGSACQQSATTRTSVIGKGGGAPSFREFLFKAGRP